MSGPPIFAAMVSTAIVIGLAASGSTAAPEAQSTGPGSAPADVVLELSMTPGGATGRGRPDRWVLYQLHGDGDVRYRPLEDGRFDITRALRGTRIDVPAVRELLDFALGPADLDEARSLYPFATFGPAGSTLIDLRFGDLDRRIEYQLPPGNLLDDEDPDVAGLRLLLERVLAFIEQRPRTDYVSCEPDPNVSGSGRPQVVADTTAEGPTALEDGATDPAPATPRGLGGRWRRMTPGPFAAAGASFAWTGDELVVFRPRVRRVAAYEPQADRWRHLPWPSRPYEGSVVADWTGREVILLGAWRGEIVGSAFDPELGSWRELPASPLRSQPHGVDVISDSVWAGDRLVVASTRDGGVATYQPDADCWELLQPLPISGDDRTIDEPQPGTLHWTGEEILSMVWDPPIDPYLAKPRAVVSRFDPAKGAWVDTGPTPLVGGSPAGLWAADRLWFLGGAVDDAGDPSGATYDPATGVWDVFPFHCGPGTTQAFWTGRLIIDAGMALDPLTSQCFRLPRVNDRTRRDPVVAWTGRELIVWSGGQGEELPAKPDGVVYRPPLSVLRDMR